MSDSLLYKLRSGKPPKILFFLKGYLQMCVPGCFFRMRRNNCLKQVERHPDKEYIHSRVDYYNKMVHSASLPDTVLHEHKRSYYIYLDKIKNFRPSTFHKAYYFDLQDVARWFNQNFRIGYIPGDVYFTPQFPAIVKSRLLKDDNANSVILKLDKLRHFLFVDDPIPFAKKADQAIFRGKIRLSRIREQFLRMYFGSSICDCGVVGRNEGYPEEWMKPKKTIREHLDYKFIMALEGNDVASNLKWVMSSNSIAVMTRPTCETWFMEGSLIPDYHYIQIKDDLSDLEEKLTYYINHPEEAEQIIEHAHEYVAQFFDAKRERLISLLVMDKYLRMTKQNI
ncbi:MAG: glycosyltransferase [Bacteroides sp.]|nr:glycosyltransferase [Bacteroides sp.]